MTGYGLGRIAYEMAALAEVAIGDDRGPAVRRMEALSEELSVGMVFGLPRGLGLTVIDWCGLFDPAPVEP